MLSKESCVNLICGHFEGVDERLLKTINIEEISIGDYILSGGETAALTIIDSILRLLPGVLGNKQSITDETFENNLLEYPQYTKPQIWQKKVVHDVLGVVEYHEATRYGFVENDLCLGTLYQCNVVV